MDYKDIGVTIGPLVLDGADVENLMEAEGWSRSRSAGYSDWLHEDNRYNY
jgi:hypothetical protein